MVDFNAITDTSDEFCDEGVSAVTVVHAVCTNAAITAASASVLDGRRTVSWLWDKRGIEGRGGLAQASNGRNETSALLPPCDGAWRVYMRRSSVAGSWASSWARHDWRNRHGDAQK